MNPAISMQPEFVLEVGAAEAPERLLSLRRAAGRMRRGQVMLLIVPAVAAQDDVIAWARTTRRDVLRVAQLEDGRRGYWIQNGDPWPVHDTVDVRGAHCPVPVVEAARRLRTMARGDVLKLLSDCRSAPADVAAWSKATGHEILATVRHSLGGYRFYIRR